MIIVYFITVTGSTYAYFALSVSSDNKISGTTATANLALTVSKVFPSNTNNLVPQLESALGSAISSTYKCVDGNNNNVCQVYKITIKNTSTASVDISGYIHFSGITNLPNLKWRLLDNESTMGTHNSYNATGADNLFVDRVKLSANQTNNYYMVIWINETNSAQSDTGTYGATISFKSSNGTGVTSTIGEIRLGENLIKNGDLSLKNNTNFSAFTYGTDSEGGYLSYTGDKSGGKYANEYIYVDTSKKYQMSADFKSNNTTAIFYAGFRYYDAALKYIEPTYVMYIDGSLTSLKQDLKNGDTTVYLNDVSKFQVDSSTPTYRLGLIFWNYTDNNGYTWPEETYSRNAWENLYTYDAVDKTNNTITLSSPWNHGTIQAGTKLSQSSSWGNNYILLEHSPITTTWENYSGIIEGINTTGLNSVNKFQYGTVYIRPYIIFNYNSTPDTTLYLRNFVFKEIE